MIWLCRNMLEGSFHLMSEQDSDVDVFHRGNELESQPFCEIRSRPQAPLRYIT